MKELKRQRLRGSLGIGSSRYGWLALRYIFLFYLLSSNSFSCDRSTVSTSCKGGFCGSPSVFACASSAEDRERNEAVGRSSLRRSRSIAQEEKRPTMNQILIRAGKRGLGGGIPGALAGMVQVITLMWLRTIINYQCRYGTTFTQAFVTLTNDGGIARLYSGLKFALIQAPLARFVSTAANEGVETLLMGIEYTKDWGPGRTTIVASVVVGFWRMFLMPIDTIKTVLQVDSVEGFRSLMRRVKAGNFNVLYEGAYANAISAILGHYPWFFTYNTLSTSDWVRSVLPSQLLRNAGIGLVASIISDTVVNAVRVVKTSKQSIGSKHAVTYSEIIRMILAADGWRGLFGRGLRTRIFANALQSIVFTVIWRGLAEKLRRKGVDKVDKETDHA